MSSGIDTESVIAVPLLKSLLHSPRAESDIGASRSAMSTPVKPHDQSSLHMHADQVMHLVWYNRGQGLLRADQLQASMQQLSQ